jgi:hypothetical protein
MGTSLSEANSHFWGAPPLRGYACAGSATPQRPALTAAKLRSWQTRPAMKKRTIERQKLKERDFFSDDDYAANCAAIDEAIAKIPQGATVVIPEDGLGTGLAQLPQRAPKTYHYLCRAIDKLS